MATLARSDHAAARNTSGLALIARAGYAAHGVVYLIIGSFAVAAGLGSGERMQGSRGALASLRDEPFGQVLFLCVAAGLVMFGLHNIVQAAWRRVAMD